LWEVSALEEAAVIRCNRRQIVRAGLLVSLAGFRADAARCQPRYPERPIRVIVPFAAGGVGEAAIRVLAPGMEQKLGQKLVVEPKPGGAGNLGAREVARADDDGYTILVAAAGNFVINQFLTKMPFDPLAALTPIAKIAEIPIVFCSNPSVPVQSLAEFVAYARAHRGKFNYGSPGNGSVNHLVVENLKHIAGIEITHIPYRGSPPATLAALANEIQLYAIGLAAVAGHLKDGKLTALAVTTKNRLAALPEVPTVIEAGFPGLVMSNWWAMAVPARTPEPVVGLLNQAVVEALNDASVAEHFAALGMHVPTQTREQFIASLGPEADLWSQVIARGKIVSE
jgi:tripartite-type tricarboxylate transporter receptor subunit TctC